MKKRFEKANHFREYHYRRRHGDGTTEPILSRAAVDKGYYKIAIIEAGDDFWLRQRVRLNYALARLTGWYWWNNNAHKSTGTQ